jgi:hypothetical protein
MSVSLKEIIFQRYNQFLNEISPITDTSLFPDINDVDIVDLLALVEIFFPPSQRTEISLRNVITMKSLEVDDEKLLLIIPILDKFLKFIEKIKTL